MVEEVPLSHIAENTQYKYNVNILLNYPCLGPNNLLTCCGVHSVESKTHCVHGDNPVFEDVPLSHIAENTQHQYTM